MFYNTTISSSIIGITGSSLQSIVNTSTGVASYTSTTIAQPSRIYYINGHEVEVNNVYNVEYYAIVFSMISLFGYKSYETLKLNGFSFEKSIEDRLKSIFREEKIDSVLVDNNK